MITERQADKPVAGKLLLPPPPPPFFFKYAKYFSEYLINRKESQIMDNFPGIYYRLLFIHMSALFKSVRNESDLKRLTVRKVTYLKASLQICILVL